MIKRLFYIILQRLYVSINKNKPCQGKVYMFHNISDVGDTYSISLEHFKEMLDYFSENKKIVDIDTLINEKYSDNIVLTFDDAYKSVYEHAYPLLKEMNVPYYVFICNEFTDKDEYLSSDMIKKMSDDSKCIIGSHGMKHALSRFMDDDTYKNDLKESKNILESLIGKKVSDFAFPYGSMYACSDDNIRNAKEVYDNVFMTYNLGYNSEYERVIPRININDSNYRSSMK